jgi:polysaccharide biosynthesis transport protein
VPDAMDDVAGMTLSDVASVIGRRKWLVSSAMLVFVAAAGVFTALQTPMYATSSKVLVQARGQDGLFGDVVRDVNDRSIETEIQIIEGQEIRERVRSDLDLVELPSAVSAAVVGQTDVVALTVRDPSASDAALLADAYARAYIEVRREQSVAELTAASVAVRSAMDGLQSEIDALTANDPRRPTLVTQLASLSTTFDQLGVDAALRSGGAVIVTSADVPVDPVEPTPIRTVGLAAMLGFLCGVALAFLVDRLDNRVRSDTDFDRLGGGPVLAVVPVGTPPDGRPITLSAPAAGANEAYRGLRTNVQFLGLDRGVGVILVSSSVAGEGKTTTASNLAVVLAQAGHRVAIVDADLRRPRLHEVFGVAQCPGLTDRLIGGDPTPVVREVDVDGVNLLSVYPSGPIPSNAGELLSSQEARRLFAELGEQYDYVVVDSAPIVPVSDSVALSRWVHGVVIVAHAGRTKQPDLLEAIHRLEQVGATVLGTVLNHAAKSSHAAPADGAGTGRNTLDAREFAPPESGAMSFPEVSGPDDEDRKTGPPSTVAVDR